MVSIRAKSKNGLLYIIISPLRDGCERQNRGEFLPVNRALESISRDLLCVERENAVKIHMGSGALANGSSACSETQKD